MTPSCTPIEPARVIGQKAVEREDVGGAAGSAVNCVAALSEERAHVECGADGRDAGVLSGRRRRLCPVRSR